MNIKAYAKDNIVNIILFIIFEIFVYMMLYIFKFGVAMAVMICVIALVFFLAGFIWSYIRKRDFYRQMTDNTERMDKKYLVLETVKEPDFLEGRLMYSWLYDIDKSMIEHINEYEHSQQDFKDFIEMWVHEIKLPIASLTLMCHNDREHIDKKFLTQVERLDDYADKVLYYVRSENAEKDYSFGRVPLRTVINKVAVKNKNLILENNISLNVHDVENVVNTDAKWLEFILNQIISNSIKYRKMEDAFIEIWSVKAGNELQQSSDGLSGIQHNCKNTTLIIKDNGIGIKASDIANVFDKSFTGANGRLGTKSTGMGLYIAKNLCDKLGHAITIESVENEYTQVSITFAEDDFYRPVNE